MNGSSSRNSNIVFAAYKDARTVFRLKDIAMLSGETDFTSINKKMHYWVKTGKFLNPRKGIYAKEGYNKEELACILYTPAYLSLEYVLQKAGVIFQYDSSITVVGYLSRTLVVDEQTYVYRKLKSEVLVSTLGILRLDNQINIATPERAFLDLLYLNSHYYFDNLAPLNLETIQKLLPIYNSKALTNKVEKLFTHG